MLEVPLQRIEMVVSYGLNGGEGIEFVVPKLGQNLRWAAHSCNGELPAFSNGRKDIELIAGKGSRLV